VWLCLEPIEPIRRRVSSPIDQYLSKQHSKRRQQEQQQQQQLQQQHTRRLAKTAGTRNLLGDAETTQITNQQLTKLKTLFCNCNDVPVDDDGE
jgi:hypothetical protein